MTTFPPKNPCPTCGTELPPLRAKGTGEAVAWRHRSDMDGIWTWAYTGDPAQAEVYRRKGHEVEPLYASPPVALPEGNLDLTASGLEGPSLAAAGKSREDTHLWPIVSELENPPTIRATANGSIGIQVGGLTIYKTLEEWHALALSELDARTAELRSRLQPAAAVEGSLKECDCCGEMRPDVRTSYIPHAGDTSACAECRSEGAPQDLRAQAIEECAKWHDAQFDKYAKLAKKAADLQDMTSNGFHADTAQHHMMSAVALRAQLRHPPQAGEEDMSNDVTPSPLEGASTAAAGWRRENGPSDEAIQQAIKATEYKYFGDYPMSDGQIDAVGVLVAAARALIRSRLQPAAAVEAPSAEDVTPLSPPVGVSAALRAEDGWQPIETVPKSGGTFLAYCPALSNAGFGALPERIAIFSGAILQRAMDPSYPKHLQFPATHWMPLPASPNAIRSRLHTASGEASNVE